MAKHLKITLTHGNIHHDMLILGENEYPYVYLKKEITDEDAERAIDILATFFMQRQLNFIDVDLEKRNDALAPAKDMTLEEIEKELGYKIKIVKDK